MAPCSAPSAHWCPVWSGRPLAELLFQHDVPCSIIFEHTRPALAADDAHGRAALSAGEFLDVCDERQPTPALMPTTGNDHAHLAPLCLRELGHRRGVDPRAVGREPEERV